MTVDRAEAFWMQRALELARLALDAGETPVGAVVVRDGQMLGEGQECTRRRLDPSAHAEVEAVRAACHGTGTLDLAGATCYTTVEPCLLCSCAIRLARIARVVYGTDAGPAGGICGNWRVLTDTTAFPGSEPPEVAGGLLAGECASLLELRRRLKRALPGDHVSVAAPRR